MLVFAEKSSGITHLNTWTNAPGACPTKSICSGLALGLGEHVQTAEAEDVAGLLLRTSGCS